MSYYEYRHLVTFQETNVVGNVYYTHYLEWQGRCRELFLNEHAPEILSELERGLSLATVRCSCEYFMELEAFDEVIVRMKLAEQAQNRLTLAFEYWRSRDGTEELVARGEQQVASMRREGARLVPAPLPAALREALAPYVGNGSC
jgi:enediyne biosynthesis thioesterase